MKRLLLLSVALAAPLLADLYVEGDVLFLRPCTDQLYFVLKGPATAANTPMGKEFAIKPDYDVGYSVRLGTTLCCDRGAAELGWQVYDGRSTRILRTSADDGVLLWDILSAPDNGFLNFANGVARGRTEFDYTTVHATGKWGLNPGSSVLATLFGGLRYSKIKFREDVVYVDFANNVQTDVLVTSDCWGLGPYVGVRGDYPVWCGVGLFASGDVGLLVGRIASATFQSTTATASDEDVVNVSKERACRNLFHYGFEVGVGMTQCIGCASFSAAAGYQLREYLSAIQNVSFYSRIREGASSTGDNPFDLSGFFIRLQVEV